MFQNSTARAWAVLALCLGLAGTSLAASSAPRSAPRSAQSNDLAAAVVAAALAERGDAYAWGGAGPDVWDCSGLVYSLWRKVGGVQDVPRVSRHQHAWAVPLPIEQVLPGDLVFFNDPVNHVGLVTGRTGTSIRMVDSASSLKGVVERAAWAAKVVRFGRVPRAGMPAIRPWTPAPTVPPTLSVTAPAQPLTLPVAVPRAAGTRVAQAAAAAARQAVGTADVGDVAFVRQAWRSGGGRELPSTREALLATGTAVAFADARVGDLVVYGPPGTHVGIYLGDGLMVSSSRRLAKVVLRKVWESPTLHLVRLPG